MPSPRVRAEFAYEGRYGGPPRGFVTARGRLLLLGEHVEPGGGPVLALPLRLGVACAWGPRPDRSVRIVALDAKAGDRCADERPRCGPGRKTECVAREALGVKDQVIDPATTWIDKDGWATTVGPLRTSLGPGRPTIMAFGMSGPGQGGRVAWDEVVSSDDSAEDHALIGAASEGGRLVLFTKEQPGKFLVRSLDTRTGEEQWHVDVDQPAHAGVSVRVTLERVYVTMTFAGRERVQVYEAASGKDFGAIQDVTSSRVAPGLGAGGLGGYGGYGYRPKSYAYPAYGYPVE